MRRLWITKARRLLKFTKREGHEEGVFSSRAFVPSRSKTHA